jgi:DNA-binding HxlR family transcriptional regulator
LSSLLPAIQLFHYRWSVPTVARLYRDGPQRVARLQEAFNAARDTLADTIRRLEQAGVLCREPAPRGAICSLTSAGQAVGASCSEAVEAVVAMDLVQLALKKWPMLVLVAAGRGASRFNQLRAELPGITPRALTLALKDLQAAGLIERTVEHTYPPSSLYRLTPRGLELFPVMDRLCRAAEAAVAL